MEDELSPAALLLHGVVAGDHDLSEGIGIARRYAMAEHSIIGGIRDQQRARRGEDRRACHSL